MEEKNLTCCFTGHRPEKLPWGGDESDARCLKLKEELACCIDGAYLAGCRHFICGMARGCDMLFAEAALALRGKHPEVTLEAAIPCDTQADGWRADERRRYEHLTAECDEVTFVAHAYSPGCMQRRNEYMVERSDVLIAVFNGTAGGTMNTILCAQRKGLRVITIDLVDYMR